MTDIQGCLDDKIEVSFDIAVIEKIPSWVQVLETPTLKYLEIACDQLKAVKSALQDIDNEQNPEVDGNIYMSKLTLYQKPKWSVRSA